MLTYELKKAPGVPLHEVLYRCIRRDILDGTLAPGEKLPSQRALALHLEVSRITVEGAYDQLLAEGYIRSEEKVGCFVEAVERIPAAPLPRTRPETPVRRDGVDLTGGGTAEFPFTVWSRIQRSVMLDYGRDLLLSMPNQGVWELRQAICDHLSGFRGMGVRPEQVVVGAGGDFLYNLLIQLLGRDRRYALEEPGYRKIRDIYRANEVAWREVRLDSQGVMPGELGDAQVLHISPAHHFPTGLVTPMKRRLELLEWVRVDPERWIIEDDYDSEFRFDAHPMVALQSLDPTGQVIYINTFSKTLAPSIRISYLVLPPALLDRFREKLGFYSCTVASFEQYTLARFLAEGDFEKHINRMRKAYRGRRNRLLEILHTCPVADRLTVQEEDAGLHFLVRVDTELSDRALETRLEDLGIRVRTLGSCYQGPTPPGKERTLVVCYGGLGEEELERLAACLARLNPADF